MKSLKEFVNEGTTNHKDEQKWSEAVELLGPDHFIEIIYNYLSADQIKMIIDGLEQDGYFN